MPGMFRVWNRQKRRESANELRRTLRLLRVRSVVAADGRREKKSPVARAVRCVRGRLTLAAAAATGAGGQLLYSCTTYDEGTNEGSEACLSFALACSLAHSSLPSHRSRRSCRSPNPTQITPKLLSPPSYSQLSNKCLHSAAASRLPSSPPCLGPPPLVRHRARGGSLNRQLGLLLLAAVVHYTRHESSGRAV